MSQRTMPFTIAALMSALVSSDTLLAQTITYEPIHPLPHRTFALAYYNTDFSYAGHERPAVRLDFSNSVLAWSYSLPVRGGSMGRPVIKLMIGYGKQAGDMKAFDGADLSLLDAEFSFWVNVIFSESRRSQFSLITPFLLSYRRLGISAQSTVEKSALNIFRAGIGLGLGYNSRLNSRVTLELRAAPMFAFHASTLGKERSRWAPARSGRGILDADAQLHWERLLSNHCGVTFGFAFRIQRWAVAAEKYFPESDSYWFTFKSAEPAVRIGIHW